MGIQRSILVWRTHGQRSLIGYIPQITFSMSDMYMIQTQNMMITTVGHTINDSPMPDLYSALKIW